MGRLRWRAILPALALTFAVIVPAYSEPLDLLHSKVMPWLPVALAVLVVLQTVVVAVLLAQNRRQRDAGVEIREQRRELTHAARLALLGELAASIAHEVSQPFGAILSNTDAAEILLNQVPVPLSEVQQILKDIRRDDLRANDIVKRLRSLLQKRELQLETVDVNEIASHVQQLVQADGRRRNITLKFILDRTLPPIQADPIHLQQVMLNLIINAMEAVDSGSTTSRLVEVRTLRDDTEWVKVTVCDSGPGFAPDQLAKPFGPFVTTKPHGMGLGMSISRTIVKAHGGRIWTANGEFGGAIVGFSIPAQGK